MLRRHLRLRAVHSALRASKPSHVVILFVSTKLFVREGAPATGPVGAALCGGIGQGPLGADVQQTIV